MKKLLMLILLVGISALGACSDDDNTTTPSNEKIYPTTAGSSWVYKNFMIDTNGVEIPTGEIDSTVCIGTENYLGKTANVLMHYYFQDGEPTTMEKSYFYEDNSKLYMPSSDLTSDSPLGDDTPLFSARWMKVYDGTEDNWMIFDTTLTDFGFSDVTSFNGTMTISGKKSSNQDFVVNGTTISAKHAIIKVVFSGQISIPGFPLPAAISITQTNHAYVAPGIGLVAMIADPTEIPIMGKSPGSASRLIKYSIK